MGIEGNYLIVPALVSGAEEFLISRHVFSTLIKSMENHFGGNKVVDYHSFDCGPCQNI